MNAKSLVRIRKPVNDTDFYEIAIWLLPRPVKGSTHLFRYRLALVSSDDCVLRYDNEAGKGDHKHFGRKQVDYNFKDVDRLLKDFDVDVADWLRRHPK